MGNEFLIGCDHNQLLSFCLTCRQNRITEIHTDGMTRGQLQDIFLSDAEEYRRLNQLFQETLRRIIIGEAFRRECLRVTQYTSFGWWMRSQPQYNMWSDERKKRLMDQVKYAHVVYRDWDIIVTNLVHDDIVHIDARKLLIEQLFSARSDQCCADYDEIFLSTRMPESVMNSKIRR